MGYKTFADGDVLTAGDVNSYLMRQSVITCTSGTRPTSPAEGMTIYETDTDRMLTWNASAWVATASLDTTTSTALTAATGFTVNSSLCKRTAAGVVSWQGYLNVTSTITPSGSNITPDLRIATLPSGYFPTDVVCVPWDNGVTGGFGIVNVDGTVDLRTSMAAVSAATNIRISGAWVQ